MAAARTIGLVVFPDLAALDIVGPYEVLAHLGYEIAWIAETPETVTAHRGLRIVPDVTFEEAPALEVIVVPGGPGYAVQMENESMLAFLRKAAVGARIVSSVCTGSLILAGAGLLEGKKATTHWMAMDRLGQLGAIPVAERVVADGNVVTAAGVSAGIDMALILAANLAGPEAAQTIQLNIEYDPQPPFDAGSPEKAPAAIVAALKGSLKGPV
ncbi:MAG: DJ-1/PfpI family protein [Actinomycetota bacterium]